MERIEILDHGYAQHIDTWGSDERIIEAARMSTQKGFEGWGPIHHPECRGNDHPEWPCSCDPKPGDEKLLAYLWKNKHHTPFEMAGMTIEVQAPIFVFREWHRHRVPHGYNEASARYSPLPDINYVPSIERLMVNVGGANKQAGMIKDAEVLDEHQAGLVQVEMRQLDEMIEKYYQSWLKRGVPKELARIKLPVGRYSKMRATSNLRGWLSFLTLRFHKAAQQEIRVYAEAVHTMLSEAFPRTLSLWDETSR